MLLRQKEIDGPIQGDKGLLITPLILPKPVACCIYDCSWRMIKLLPCHTKLPFQYL